MEKFFISQPMKGRTEAEILEMRQKIIDTIEQNFETSYILDSFLTGAADVDPLVCLGHAITILSKADIAVFAPGYEDSRGCQVEYLICERYDKSIYQAVETEDGMILVPVKLVF